MRLLALFCFLLLPLTAEAKSWQVDYAQSKLGFVGMQGDTKFEGGFRDYDLTIMLDPEKPETGRINAVIKTSSVTAGNDERDSYLPQPDWFDTSRFPKARFVSTAIRKDGTGYVAEGNLTIKDVTQPISLRFTLSPEGDTMRATGETSLMRNQFRLGLGDWNNENYVKYSVQVVFDLVARLSD